jgi:exopolyphosphatase / guanosine-5'-triphosphate,3'-diphosphate pyrophosphatase
MSKHYAIVSVGTNSTRVLLADVALDPPRVEIARSIGTRIGEKLGKRGRLGDEPMERTIEAIAQLQRSVRGHYVKLFAVATSALRRAENGDEFAHRVEHLLGVPLRVLTGEEEAAASYRGAITVLRARPGERMGVIDLGGGSTEYAIGVSATPEQLVSCEIGAVRLTEAEPILAGNDGAVDAATIERARASALKALAPIEPFPAVDHLAFVGGSASTTAAILRARRGAFTSHALSRNDLQHVLTRLCGMSLQQRKEVVGMKPQRADILPAGIIILETVMDLIKRETAVATTADLLLGYLLQQHDLAEPAGQRTPMLAGSDTRRGFRG